MPTHIKTGPKIKYAIQVNGSSDIYVKDNFPGSALFRYGGIQSAKGYASATEAEEAVRERNKGGTGWNPDDEFIIRPVKVVETTTTETRTTTTVEPA